MVVKFSCGLDSSSSNAQATFRFVRNAVHFANVSRRLVALVTVVVMLFFGGPKPSLFPIVVSAAKIKRKVYLVVHH